jgi:DNA-binding NarL/FixJ family response regulator
LTYDCKAPCVKILMASVGVRLASVLGDDGLFRRCHDPAALKYAFRSGEPGRIGPLVSALIRAHLLHGETTEAKALLKRALSVVRNADHAWDLMIDAATLGEKDERRAARTLLEARAALPSGDVASAYLHSFDAALAGRNRDHAAQRRSAHRAAHGFKRIGWRAQERFALGYADERQPKIVPDAEPPSRAFRTMLGGLSTLTRREAEVAEFALKGLTNREIAKELSISEHTVESHMTSIMNRLGIRSRHQLSNMVVDSGKAATA